MAIRALGPSSTGEQRRGLGSTDTGGGARVVWCGKSCAAVSLLLDHTLRTCCWRAVTPRMSRDQRMADNWALLHALEQAAAKGVPCAVAFNLVSEACGWVGAWGLWWPGPGCLAWHGSHPRFQAAAR
jgi:hypothetical protein